MEFTSLLAGERWTDQPASVCPALAALARAVNDRVSDTARQELALLAVDCIGTSQAPPEVRLAAARRALTTAFEHTRDDHARFTVLVGLIAIGRAADGHAIAGLQLQAELMGSPLWRAAERFVAESRYRPRDFLRYGLPAAYTTTVDVIADAPNADDLLVGLLRSVVADYRNGVRVGSGRMLGRGQPATTRAM